MTRPLGSDYVALTHSLLRFLAYISDHPGQGATEIARNLGIARLQVYRMQETAALAFGAVVEQDSRGKLSLTTWGILAP